MEQAKTTNINEVSDEKDLQNLDLGFLLDCTGSMQPFIDLARDKIKDTITEVRAQYPDSQIRVGIVGYRDVKDKTRFEIFQFSESIDEARSFLEVKAEGGQDIPEDMNGGFRNMLYNLEWKNFTRMLYQITDAPCHGKMFHSELDNFPKGHTEDVDWKILFTDMIKMNINFVFMKIHHRTDKMMTELKKIYDNCEKTEVDVIFNLETLAIPNQVEAPEKKLSVDHKKHHFDAFVRKEDVEPVLSSSPTIEKGEKEEDDAPEGPYILECYIPGEKKKDEVKSEKESIKDSKPEKIKKGESKTEVRSMRSHDDFVGITATRATTQIASNIEKYRKIKK